MPPIVWHLDDGHSSIWTHRGVWQEVGVQPAIGLQANEVGNANWQIDWQQADQLLNGLGWELLNHGLTGGGDETFDVLGPSRIRQHVHDAHDIFVNRGYCPTAYVYNQGKDGGSTGRSIVGEVYDWGFIVGGGTVADSNGRYQIRRQNADKNSISTLKSVIDRAAANDEAVVLNSHILKSGSAGGNLETSLRKIREIVPYARQQGMTWTDTATVAQYHYSGSAPCSGGGGTDKNRLTITAGSDDLTDYYLRVDGGLEATASIGSEDQRLNDQEAEGTVAGAGVGTDTWLFEGELQEFTYSPETVTAPTVEVNGESVAVPYPPSDPDPCAGVSCGDCLVCVDGDCVLQEGAECADDVDCVGEQVCEDCQCVDPTTPGPCDGVACPPGETCVDGECVPDGGGGVDPRLVGALAGVGLGTAYYLTRGDN